jgi:hypothetical protein
MTTKRLLIAVMTVFFCLASGTPALAADPRPQGAAAQSAGKISALLPIAKLVRGQGNAAVISEAKKDDQLIWQDLVKTEKGGRARITLNDNSILSVGSQSELRITKHDARSNQTSLELTYGRVRAEVTKVTRDGGKFEVKTPTAVAGHLSREKWTSPIPPCREACNAGRGKRPPSPRAIRPRHPSRPPRSRSCNSSWTRSPRKSARWRLRACCRV